MISCSLIYFEECYFSFSFVVTSAIRASTARSDLGPTELLVSGVLNARDLSRSDTWISVKAGGSRPFAFFARSAFDFVPSPE